MKPTKKVLIALNVIAAVLTAQTVTAEGASQKNIDGVVGETTVSEFTSELTDVVITYKVESGAEYEIYIVDGYNNGKNEGLKLDKPAKAVGFWVLKADGTAYPKSMYSEQEKDSKSSYGFIGVTPERKGPAVKVKAEGTVLVVHVQRYKTSYTGQFAVKVVKK